MTRTLKVLRKNFRYFCNLSKKPEVWVFKNLKHHNSPIATTLIRRTPSTKKEGGTLIKVKEVSRKWNFLLRACRQITTTIQMTSNPSKWRRIDVHLAQYKVHITLHKYEGYALKWNDLVKCFKIIFWILNENPSSFFSFSAYVFDAWGICIQWNKMIGPLYNRRYIPT